MNRNVLPPRTLNACRRKLLRNRGLSPQPHSLWLSAMCDNSRFSLILLDEVNHFLNLSRHNETFSRVLIDKALEASDWDLINDHQVQFEHNSPAGRIDYLLKDSLGRVLCVL